ncbi:MAG: hypothetical protein OXI41_01680 [Chloroflexota bacterium]|nr:hypothetical protein [Chloroflexota bacterium]MDE2894212.1 hypothetical protein [Chloroflexota bacterium]
MHFHVERAQLLERRTAIAAVVLIAAVIAVVALVLTGRDARGQEPRADVAAEVRIAAQRLEDGEVRFGLRVRDSSGEWVEPMTPRAHRFDPASVSAGRWLVSSPLTLEVDRAGHGRLARSDQFEPSPRGDVKLVSGVEGWAGDAHYSAYHSEDGDLVTSVSMYSTSVGTPDGELRTTIACRDGETSVSIGGLPGNLSIGALTHQISVAWSVDNGTRHREHRALTSGARGPELVDSTESRLARALLGVGSHLALAIGTTPELTANVDLDALRALPVYDNLRHCAGEAVQTGSTELRIRAQVRVDQRIEFAVQQRIAGGWSDNILPRARVIAAFGEATDWLSSTPVSVRVALDPPLAIVMPDTVVRRAPEPITPVLRNGYRTNSLAYGVLTQDIEGYHPTRLNSAAVAFSEQGLQLRIECIGNERRVLLADLPSDASGNMILYFDDKPLLASWNTIEHNGATALRPSDIDRTIQRLRQARSLSVQLGPGDAAPITLNLIELFNTPVQVNIDQCGNYAVPHWQPVTKSLLVHNELGEYYTVSYPEGNDPQRGSQVRVAAVEGTPAAGTDRLDLVMTCRSGRVTFDIWGLPALDQPDAIRLRIDGGEWFAEQARVFVGPDGTASVEFSTDLDRLQQGRTLRFAYGIEKQAQGAFDLTNLLGTPIHANFDNCGRDYWPPARTYVPVVAAQEQSSRHLSYVARKNFDDTVTTSVALTAADVPEPGETISLQLHCFESSSLETQVIVPLVSEAGGIEVTLTIDDRPADTTSWTLSPTSTRSFLYPPSNAQMLAQLRGASVAIMEAPGLLPEPIRFDVGGLFDTPVQSNIDECGYYRPGEVRTQPIPLNAYDVGISYDPERGLTLIRLWERTPGRASQHQALTLEQHHRDGSLLIGLSMLCGPYGARLSISGPVLESLTGEQAEVEWRLDGAIAQRETWNLISVPGRSLSPQRARPVMASWREASELELSLLGAEPAVHRFHLEAMFDNPVIDTLDECLEMPIASRQPTVTSIPLTMNGPLNFAATGFDGSGWLTSYAGLADTGEAPAQAGARDLRSILAFSCGMDGLDIAIDSLNRAQRTYIQGDTVEVTWNIDGRSRTERWAAWTQSLAYVVSPDDDAEFYEALKDARTLTIRVESDPPISKTYELAKHGFWSTPVLPNLDACGG